MLDGWANFFLAQVGAAAALTGTIYVAVSINLTKILAYPTLPGRALEALLYLLTVLVIGTLGLVPGQPLWLLGAEILGVWLIVCAVTLTNQIRALRAPEARVRRPTRVGVGGSGLHRRGRRAGRGRAGHPVGGGQASRGQTRLRAAATPLGS